MTKTIQMIKTSDDNSLFITAFNVETNELTFRTSRTPEYLQKEKITFDETKVYTNLYFFDRAFLEKFIYETNHQ